MGQILSKIYRWEDNIYICGRTLYIYIWKDPIYMWRTLYIGKRTMQKYMCEDHIYIYIGEPLSQWGDSIYRWGIIYICVGGHIDKKSEPHDNIRDFVDPSPISDLNLGDLAEFFEHFL